MASGDDEVSHPPDFIFLAVLLKGLSCCSAGSGGCCVAGCTRTTRAPACGVSEGPKLFLVCDPRGSRTCTQSGRSRQNSRGASAMRVEACEWLPPAAGLIDGLQPQA